MVIRKGGKRLRLQYNHPHRPTKQGPYYVIRDTIVIRGFDSFYEAYRYALNRFCSEDFLVQKEGW